MTSDQNSQITSRHIKNELALIALIFIDGGGLGTKMTKNGTQYRDGNIGNGIKLFIGQRNAGFVMRSDIGIFANNGRVSNLSSSIGNTDCFFYQLFIHSSLHYKVPN